MAFGKSEEQHKEHGISFEEAAQVFVDDLAIIIDDLERRRAESEDVHEDRRWIVLDSPSRMKK